MDQTSQNKNRQSPKFSHVFKEVCSRDKALIFFLINRFGGCAVMSRFWPSLLVLPFLLITAHCGSEGNLYSL